MSFLSQGQDEAKNRNRVDNNGEMCEQDFGHGISASVATEEDIDDIANFLRLFGFPQSDSKTADKIPLYANPALPLGSYSETDVRGHLFNYTAAFFGLRVNGVLSMLLSFRFPLPQFSNTSIMMDVVLSLSPTNTNDSLLSKLLNFAFDCLPRISIMECTKVKVLVLKDSEESSTICEMFKINGFVEESTLRDEFGPKRDVVIYSRWFSPQPHTEREK